MTCGKPKDGFRDFKSKAALKRWVGFLKRNRINPKVKKVRVNGVKKTIKL
jgi:hypothetical protein